MGMKMSGLSRVSGVLWVLTIASFCSAVERPSNGWTHVLRSQLSEARPSVFTSEPASLPSKNSPSYLKHDDWKPITLTADSAGIPMQSARTNVHQHRYQPIEFPPASIDPSSETLELKPVVSLAFLKHAATSQEYQNPASEAQASFDRYKKEADGFVEPFDMDDFFKDVGISHKPLGFGASPSNTRPTFHPAPKNSAGLSDTNGDTNGFLPHFSSSSFGGDSLASFSHLENQDFSAFINSEPAFRSDFGDIAENLSPKETQSSESTKQSYNFDKISEPLRTWPGQVIHKRKGEPLIVPEQTEVYETEKLSEAPQKVIIPIKVPKKSKTVLDVYEDNCELVERPLEEERDGNSRYRRGVKKPNKKMLTCLVCETPTGGYTERCSFSSAKPEHKSFATSSTIKYDVVEEPEAKQDETEESVEEPASQTQVISEDYGHRLPIHVLKPSLVTTKENSLAKASMPQIKYIPQPPVAVTERHGGDGGQNTNYKNLDRSYNIDDSESNYDDSFKDGFMTSASGYDDFFAKGHGGHGGYGDSNDDGGHFDSHDFELSSGSSHYGDDADFGFDFPPEYRPQQESKHLSGSGQSGNKKASDVTASAQGKKSKQQQETGDKKALNSAVSSFNGKDRKNCKESIKESSKTYGRRNRRSAMKCYTCTDDKGKEREECMLAERDPHSHHVMFSEYEEY